MLHSQRFMRVQSAAVRAAIVVSVLGAVMTTAGLVHGGGCATSGECPPGFFCQTATGDCNGIGTCQPVPASCPPPLGILVCGCNGVTYLSACQAAAAGVSIAHFGACGKPSPCADSGACPPGFFCQTQPGDCDGFGTCQPIPEVCPLIFDPVCGCDGQTYNNACFAAAAGVSVAREGFCAPQPNPDLNGDGVVDGIDLGILLSNWSIPPGSPGCGGSVPCTSDLNGDGVVDGLDLGILLSNWSI